MTLTELATIVRNELPPPMLKQHWAIPSLEITANRALRSIVIPKLIMIGGYMYVDQLLNTQAVTMTEKEESCYLDLKDSESGLTNDYYPVSLSAWVNKDTAIDVSEPWVNGTPVRLSYGEAIRDLRLYSSKYHTVVEWGEILGNRLVINNVYTHGCIRYVERPDYSSANTIELDEDIIDSLAVWATCWQAVAKDKGGAAGYGEYWKMFHDALADYRWNARKKQKPIESVPVNYGWGDY